MPFKFFCCDAELRKRLMSGGEKKCIPWKCVPIEWVGFHHNKKVSECRQVETAKHLRKNVLKTKKK